MNALPIVRRELLILARRRWFYWLRTGVGVATALVGVIVFAMTAGAGSPVSLGGPLFTTVTVMSFLVCLLAGPVLLADSIAEERAAGTLGLLFLTNTRSHDIVGGKFIAMAMPALHCLLAAMPVAAIGFFLGGVTPDEFIRTTAALLNLLFFSLAAAIFCSAIARSGRLAFGGSLLIVLLCGACLGSVGVLLPGSTAANFWLLSVLASPCLAFWYASDANFATHSAAYSSALSIGHAMGWAFLVGAMETLPYNWREAPRPAGNASVVFRPRATARTGTQSPLAWLARNRLGGTFAAWMQALGVALFISLLFLVARSGAFGALTVVFVAYLLHALFKVWVGWVSSRAFGMERDSGALELLLITPLGETAIWRAWLTGLRRRFLIPALTLAGFDLLLAWLAAFHTGDGEMHLEIFFLTLMGAVMFLFDCYTLTWTGLWSGLISRNPTRACIRTLLWPLVIPGGVFLTLAFGAAVTGTMDLELFTGLVLAWFGVSFLLNLGLTILAMVRLSHDCREAVVKRFM